MHAMSSTQLNAQGGPSADLWGSFSNILSCDLQLTWSPKIHSSISSVQGVCQLQPQFFLFSEPGNSLHAVAGAIIELTYFFSCLLRIIVLCCFKIFCLVYLVSGGRINLIPDTLYWLEAEVFSGYLKFPNYRCSIQSWS